MISTTNDMHRRVAEIVHLLMQRPITEAVAMQIGATPGFEHLEIKDGEWVGIGEEPDVGGEEHGWIEAIIITMLTTWALGNRTGRVYPGDTDFVIDGSPDDIRVVRRPDVSFVSDARVSPSRGYIFGAPDLAVEIISPSERPGQIREKLAAYLRYGVRQVWQVYPDTQEIVVNLPDGSAHTYTSGETLSGGDVLPGFELDVAQVFATNQD